MRDMGFDFYWQDKYATNIFASGFEYNPKCLGGRVEAVTTFETFEHFINPIEEIGELIDISNNIIFSTVLLPEPLPNPNEWWYYGHEHGQHISFYSKKTFRYIAQKFGLFYSNSRNLHIFSQKKSYRHCIDLAQLNLVGLHKLVPMPQSKTLTDNLKMKHFILSD